MVEAALLTVRNGNPELTFRYSEGNHPLLIVTDSARHLPLDAPLLNDWTPTLIAVSQRARVSAANALRDTGSYFWLVPGSA